MADSHREEIAKLEALYASNPGGRVFVHLAEAYRKAGEHERARRILSEGLERHTDSASGYVVLGRVLADAQEDAEAEAAFQRVLELDSGNLVALRWLGDLASRDGRVDEARAHYRDLLARNPNNQEARDLIAALERLPADDTAASGAPGRAGDTVPAEPEFGMIEMEDLPGDLGELADAQALAREPAAPPAGESAEGAPSDSHATDELAAGSELEDVTSLEEEPEFVGGYDTEAEAASFEAEEFDARDDEATAEPVDAHLLDASLSMESFETIEEDMYEDTGEALTVDLSEFEQPADTEEYMEGSVDLSGFAEPGTAMDSESEGVDSFADGAFVDLGAETPAWSAGGAADAEPDVAEADDRDADRMEDEGGQPAYGETGSAPWDATSSFEETPAEERAPDLELAADSAEEDAADRGLSADTAVDDRSADTLSAEPTDEAAEPTADEIGVEFLGDGTEDVASSTLLDVVEPVGVDDAGTLEGPWAADGVAAMELAEEAFITPDPLEEAASDAGAEDVGLELLESAVQADGPEDDAVAAPDTGLLTEEQQAEAAAAEAVPLEGVQGGYDSAVSGTPTGAGSTAAADPGLATETMAELYRAQGFTDRAIEVYRTLLLRRPDDERLAARLRELEAPATAPEEPGEDDDAGEVWLRGVGAWTASPSDTDTATPYSWTEPDETAPSEPVGQFLRSLIGWRAGSTDTPGEPEPMLLDHPVTPSSAPSDPTATAETGSANEPWRMPASADVAEPWSAAEQTTSVEAEPAHEAAASTSAEPWSEPEPAAPESWAEAAPSAPTQGGTTAMPRGLSPVEAAFHEWYSGTPAAPTGDEPAGDMEAAGEVEAAAEPEPAPPAVPAAAAPEQEDEDLEMFRSWLQSLKK